MLDASQAIALPIIAGSMADAGALIGSLPGFPLADSTATQTQKFIGPLPEGVARPDVIGGSPASYSEATGIPALSPASLLLTDSSSTSTTRPPFPGATAVDLPTVPSAASLMSDQASTLRPATIRPMTLSAAPALRAFAQSAASTPDAGGDSFLAALDDSGSGSGNDSGSGSGSGLGIDPNPANFTLSLTDDAGDTQSETVSYYPNSDQTFTFDLLVSYSIGAPPSTNPDLDNNPPSSGETGSFDFNIDSTLNSLVFAITDSVKGSYNINDTLSGNTNNGTWADMGIYSSKATDTITLNSDGTGSETFSDDESATDKYNLTDAGAVAPGVTFTWNDGGKVTYSYHENGSDSSDGTGTDAHHEDLTNNETPSIGETGPGGVVIAASATVNYEDEDDLIPIANTPGASIETTTITDNSNDNSDYSDSGSIDGGSYNDDDHQTDTYANSSTVTANTLTGTTDDELLSGSDTEDLHLSISGINDLAGSGSDSDSDSGDYGTNDNITEHDTRSDTYRDTQDTAPNSIGQMNEDDEDFSTGHFSNSLSGVDTSGPFSSSRDGSDTVDFTYDQGSNSWTDNGTYSPPDGTSTGSPPTSGPLADAFSALSEEATYDSIQSAAYSSQAVVAVAQLLPDKPAPQMPSVPVGLIKWDTAKYVADATSDDTPTGIPGENWVVQDSKGNSISIWKAKAGQPNNYQFFCHGLTFGGVSAPNGPFSPTGDSVQTLIDDGGYTRIRNQKELKAGDIVVFYKKGPDGKENLASHTATLTSDIQLNGNYLGGLTTFLSKNGFAPGTSSDWATLMKIYGPGGSAGGAGFRFYRPPQP